MNVEGGRPLRRCCSSAARAPLKTVWPPGRWKAGARGNASDISGALSEVPGGPSPRCARLLTVR